MLKGILMVALLVFARFVDKKAPVLFFGKENAARREKEGKGHGLLSFVLVTILLLWGILALITVTVDLKNDATLFTMITVGTPVLLSVAALISRKIANRRNAFSQD